STARPAATMRLARRATANTTSSFWLTLDSLRTSPSAPGPLVGSSIVRTEATDSRGAWPFLTVPSPTRALTTAASAGVCTWSSTQSTVPCAGTSATDTSDGDWPGMAFVYSDAPVRLLTVNAIGTSATGAAETLRSETTTAAPSLP